MLVRLEPGPDQGRQIGGLVLEILPGSHGASLAPGTDGRRARTTGRAGAGTRRRAGRTAGGTRQHAGRDSGRPGGAVLRTGGAGPLSVAGATLAG
ncbi:hypothetical protein GCM10010519_47390 [Streptomyces lactacystinicus]